ncbi:MAG: Crp/Fnr family transcriptional regulator [Candidatus Bipolaricaulia bacterium]
MPEQVKVVEFRKSPLADCTKEDCSPLFAGLSEKAFAELAELMLFIEYKKGELIFQEGSFASGVYIICSGQVKYGKYSANRKKNRLLKIINHGGILGMEELFEPIPRIGYARALKDTQVAFIERSHFVKFIGKHPAMLLRICKELSRELMIFEFKLVEASYETLEKNISRLLLSLAARYGVQKKSGLYIEAELSRTDLAQMLGISLETAIHMLARLKNKGLIASDKHRIIIIDKEGLESLAEPLPACYFI